MKADIGNKITNALSRPVIFANQLARKGMMPPITPSVVLRLKPISLNRIGVENRLATREGRKLN